MNNFIFKFSLLSIIILNILNQTLLFANCKEYKVIFDNGKNGNNHIYSGNTCYKSPDDTKGESSIFGKGGNVIDKSTNNASGSSNINKSNDINTDIGVKLHK